MRRLLWAVSAILIVSCTGLSQGGLGGGGSQGQDDHDDDAPVQAGYAVITPAGVSTGLVVTETFGLKRDLETSQAGLPAQGLTRNASMFVDVSTRLGKNLGVAIVNPNSASATVTLTLRDEEGTQLGTANVTIPSRRQIAQFISELIPLSSSGGSFGGSPTPLTEYTGTLTITSTVQPVSVLGIRFRGLNFSTTPVERSETAPIEFPVLSQGIGGAGAVLLPQFAAGGGWATQIVMRNTGSSDITVRVDLFNQDGTSLTAALNGQAANRFTNLTVPAGGVLVLAPRDANGDDRF